MANIQLQQEFQERVFEKIRDSIGELLTDDELKALVGAAIEKAFFEPIKVQGSYYDSTKESWFIKEMRRLMSSRFDLAMQAWLDEHPDKVQEYLDKALAAGMGGLLERYFANLVNLEMEVFRSAMQARLSGNTY